MKWPVIAEASFSRSVLFVLSFISEKKYNRRVFDLTLPVFLAAGSAAALGIERRRLDAARRRIPLRIAVTGTRGKSTVTRLIAAAFRDESRAVLAKTTGSKPVLIRPDGSETEIRRLGRPSILEQKSVLWAAVRVRADVLASEMMSIRPECLKAEAGMILRPHVLVITNTRLDHRQEMGRTKTEIAAALARAIVPGALVFVPEEENCPAFEEAARRAGTRLVAVPTERLGDEPLRGAPDAGDFPENKRLALAVAEWFGLSRERAASGMSGAKPDFGALRVWRIPDNENGPDHFAVSAFAANDPDSTSRSIDHLARSFSALDGSRIGILNFRADREDRTRQWLDAAREGFFAGFAGVIAVGDHAAAIARRLRRFDLVAAAVPAGRPDRIMAAARALVPAGEGAVFIGMGNIVGMGTALVEYWMTIGEKIR